MGDSTTELIVTDIKHGFWSDPLHPAYQAVVAPTTTDGAPQQKPQLYPEGLYEFGAEGEHVYFDNEGSRHKVFLRPFRFAMRLATCGEYLSFIEEGVIRDLSFGVLMAGRPSRPTAGKRRSTGKNPGNRDSGNQWIQFTCSGMRNVEEAKTVCHVSYYEADAFARWAGARLPTEFEWEVAASHAKVEGNLLENGPFHPQAAPPVREDGTPLSSLVMSGNGPRAPIYHIRVTSPPLAHWVNTTANS